MIESAAWKVATHIKSVVPHHPASVERLNHSLIIILNVLCVGVLTLLASLLTGRATEVVLLLQFFAILRQLTGGLHLSSSTWCAVATAFSATVLSLLTINTTWSVIMTLISMVIIWMYAPSGIEGQTIIPPRFYPVLKVAALLLVASNLWFCSPFAALAYLIQSMTIVLYVILKGGAKP